MRLGIRITDIAVNLLSIYLTSNKGERCRIHVPCLRLEARPINAPRIQSRGSTRLKPRPLQSEIAQLIPEQIRRRFAVATAAVALFADVREAV